MLNELFWQGASFTGIALLLVGLSIWWLFFSPVKNKADAPINPDPKSAALTALALSLAAGLMIVGGLWDASMHVTTGIVPGGDDFLWPPHIMLYSGFLLSWLVAILSILQIARDGRRKGIRDPRLWIRRNPYVGAVILASLYALASIPGDAIWHELFGVDLSAWSPPHVMLAIANAAVLVSAVGLLVQARPALKSPRLADFGVLALLALMLNFAYLIGVLEWELPVHTEQVLARPIWLYPLVGGVAAFFTLLLARRLTQARWPATLTALLFYTIRLTISLGLDLTGNLAPYIPLVFILGAFLLDVVPWGRIKSLFLRDLASASLYTLGFTLLALPVLIVRPNLRAFTPLDIALTILTLLIASLAIAPLSRLASRGLLGSQSLPAA